MRDINYYCIELHTHTVHSDGSFTVQELYDSVKDYGYKGFFLTDHNTMSGHDEIEEKGLSLPKNADDPLVFKGAEWTTFFGHMLTLGCDVIGDWREARIDNIDECISKIASPDVAVALAHPLAIGNPICTGCRWEFDVKNWNNVDYIEVWNSADPEESFWNDLGYELWLDVISSGNRVACGSGRDWHRTTADTSNVALTHIGVDGEINQTNVIRAIKAGRMYATLGVRIDITITQNSNVYHLGDDILSGEAILNYEITDVELEALKQFNIEAEEILVYNNAEIIFRTNDIRNEKSHIKINLQSGFVRVELKGNIKGSKNMRILVTSPIYVK